MANTNRAAWYKWILMQSMKDRQKILLLWLVMNARGEIITTTLSELVLALDRSFRSVEMALYELQQLKLIEKVAGGSGKVQYLTYRLTLESYAGENSAASESPLIAKLEGIEE